MYKQKRVLATICARGGSKGVMNKNVRLLNGKPVIQYTLMNVASSAIVDNYVISTDSDVIMDAVKSAGFEIRFRRPAHLASDKVPRIDAIQHAVRWFEDQEKQEFDVIVDLGVATPLKSTEDLDACVKLAIDTDADNVISVCRSARNPYFNMVEVVGSQVKLVKDIGVINDRRDAPEVYDVNDAFNVWKHDVLFRENCQFNEETKVFIMPRERSVDIDEESDFTLAEYLVGSEGRRI